MDFLIVQQDRERVEFKNSALKIGFDEITAECTANVQLLQPQVRLSVLLMAWKKVGDYLTQNPYTGCVGIVVNWIGRCTLDLWFGRDWITCSFDKNTTLIEHMMKVYPTAYVTMHPYAWPYMFSIYRDPWMVEYLNINFQHMNKPDTSDSLDQKDSEFIQQEGISLILLRMIKMFDFSMVKLIKHLCLRLLWAWQDTTSLANRPIRATPNSARYIEFVRHICLIAICESNGKTELHHALECIQKNLHSSLGENGSLDCMAQVIAKGLQESNKSITEFLNDFVINVPEKCINNAFGNATNKYVAFITEYQLRKLHSSPIDQLTSNNHEIYAKLVHMFIRQRESAEEIMRTTAITSENLFSGVNNLSALKFSYEQIKQRTRPEWHTTKIVLLLAIISEELNILEELKYTENQEVDDLIAKEQQLAAFYRDLAKLLTRIPYLEQEVWLTTFSLHPCKEYMDAVTKCGSRNLRAIKKVASKFKKPETVTGTEEGLAKSAIPRTDSIFDSINEKAKIEETHSTEELIEQTVPTGFKERPLTEPEHPTSLNVNESIEYLADKSAPDEPVTVERHLKTTSTLKKDNKNKRPAVKKGATKPCNTNRSKSAEGRVDLARKPSVHKSDSKNKDSAETIYAAAAGASDKIFSLTEDSIKYPTFALVNSVTDTDDLITYTNYDDDQATQYQELNSILQNLPINCTNHDDLLSLLISPRHKRLTWAICWKQLRKRCRELLTKDKKKRQLVQQFMADANDRLTHLKIDYEKYKDKPQIDYGTIEDGYECYDTDSENESLKPTTFDSRQKNESKYSATANKPVQKRKPTGVIPHKLPSSQATTSQPTTNTQTIISTEANSAVQQKQTTSEDQTMNPSVPTLNLLLPPVLCVGSNSATGAQPYTFIAPSLNDTESLVSSGTYPRMSQAISNAAAAAAVQTLAELSKVNIDLTSEPWQCDETLTSDSFNEHWLIPNAPTHRPPVLNPVYPQGQTLNPFEYNSRMHTAANNNLNRSQRFESCQRQPSTSFGYANPPQPIVNPETLVSRTMLLPNVAQQPRPTINRAQPLLGVNQQHLPSTMQQTNIPRAHTGEIRRQIESQATPNKVKRISTSHTDDLIRLPTYEEQHSLSRKQPKLPQNQALNLTVPSTKPTTVQRISAEFDEDDNIDDVQLVEPTETGINPKQTNTQDTDQSQQHNYFYNAMKRIVKKTEPITVNAIRRLSTELRNQNLLRQTVKSQSPTATTTTTTTTTNSSSSNSQDQNSNLSKELLYRIGDNVVQVTKTAVELERNKQTTVRPKPTATELECNRQTTVRPKPPVIYIKQNGPNVAKPTNPVTSQPSGRYLNLNSVIQMTNQGLKILNPRTEKPEAIRLSAPPKPLQSNSATHERSADSVFIRELSKTPMTLTSNATTYTIGGSSSSVARPSLYRDDEFSSKPSTSAAAAKELYQLQQLQFRSNITRTSTTLSATTATATTISTAPKASVSNTATTRSAVQSTTLIATTATATTISTAAKASVSNTATTQSAVLSATLIATTATATTISTAPKASVSNTATTQSAVLSTTLIATTATATTISTAPKASVSNTATTRSAVHSTSLIVTTATATTISTAPKASVSTTPSAVQSTTLISTTATATTISTAPKASVSNTATTPSALQCTTIIIATTATTTTIRTVPKASVSNIPATQSADNIPQLFTIDDEESTQKTQLKTDPIIIEEEPRSPSPDDVIHNVAKVLNNNLLDPHLKTYCKKSAQLPNPPVVSKEEPKKNLMETEEKDVQTAKINDDEKPQKCISKETQTSSLPACATTCLNLSLSCNKNPSCRQIPLSELKKIKSNFESWCKDLSESLLLTTTVVAHLRKLKRIFDKIDHMSNESKNNSASPEIDRLIARARKLAFNLVYMREWHRASKTQFESTDDEIIMLVASSDVTYLVNALKSVSDLKRINMSIRKEENFTDSLVGEIIKLSISETEYNTDIESTEIYKTLENFALSRTNASSPTLYSPIITVRKLRDENLRDSIVMPIESPSSDDEDVADNDKANGCDKNKGDDDDMNDGGNNNGDGGGNGTAGADHKEDANNGDGGVNGTADTDRKDDANNGDSGRNGTAGPDHKDNANNAKGDDDDNDDNDDGDGNNGGGNRIQADNQEKSAKRRYSDRDSSQAETSSSPTRKRSIVFIPETTQPTNNPDPTVDSDSIKEADQKALVLYRNPNSVQSNETALVRPTSISKQARKRRLATQNMPSSSGNHGCRSARTNFILLKREIFDAARRTFNQFTVKEKAAFLRHNCRDLRIRLSRLTVRQAEMCRKPHVRLERYVVRRYITENTMQTISENSMLPCRPKEVIECTGGMGRLTSSNNGNQNIIEIDMVKVEGSDANMRQRTVHKDHGYAKKDRKCRRNGPSQSVNNNEREETTDEESDDKEDNENEEQEQNQDSFDNTKDKDKDPDGGNGSARSLNSNQTGNNTATDDQGKKGNKKSNDNSDNTTKNSNSYSKKKVRCLKQYEFYREHKQFHELILSTEKIAEDIFKTFKKIASSSKKDRFSEFNNNCLLAKNKNLIAAGEQFITRLQQFVIMGLHVLAPNDQTLLGELELFLTDNPFLVKMGHELLPKISAARQEILKNQHNQRANQQDLRQNQQKLVVGTQQLTDDQQNLTPDKPQLTVNPLNPTGNQVNLTDGQHNLIANQLNFVVDQQNSTVDHQRLNAHQQDMNVEPQNLNDCQKHLDEQSLSFNQPPKDASVISQSLLDTQRSAFPVNVLDTHMQNIAQSTQKNNIDIHNIEYMQDSVQQVTPASHEQKVYNPVADQALGRQNYQVGSQLPNFQQLTQPHNTSVEHAYAKPWPGPGPTINYFANYLKDVEDDTRDSEAYNFYMDYVDSESNDHLMVTTESYEVLKYGGVYCFYDDDGKVINKYFEPNENPLPKMVEHPYSYKIEDEMSNQEEFNLQNFFIGSQFQSDNSKHSTPTPEATGSDRANDSTSTENEVILVEPDLVRNPFYQQICPPSNLPSRSSAITSFSSCNREIGIPFIVISESSQSDNDDDDHAEDSLLGTNTLSNDKNSPSTRQTKNATESHVPTSSEQSSHPAVPLISLSTTSRSANETPPTNITPTTKSVLLANDSQTKVGSLPESKIESRNLLKPVAISSLPAKTSNSPSTPPTERVTDSPTVSQASSSEYRSSRSHLAASSESQLTASGLRNEIANSPSRIKNQMPVPSKLKTVKENDNQPNEGSSSTTKSESHSSSTQLSTPLEINATASPTKTTVDKSTDKSIPQLSKCQLAEPHPASTSLSTILVSRSELNEPQNNPTTSKQPLPVTVTTKISGLSTDYSQTRADELSLNPVVVETPTENEVTTKNPSSAPQTGRSTISQTLECQSVQSHPSQKSPRKTTNQSPEQGVSSKRSFLQNECTDSESKTLLTITSKGDRSESLTNEKQNMGNPSPKIEGKSIVISTEIINVASYFKDNQNQPSTSRTYRESLRKEAKTGESQPTTCENTSSSSNASSSVIATDTIKPGQESRPAYVTRSMNTTITGRSGIPLHQLVKKTDRVKFLEILMEREDTDQSEKNENSPACLSDSTPLEAGTRKVDSERPSSLAKTTNVNRTTMTDPLIENNLPSLVSQPTTSSNQIASASDQVTSDSGQLQTEQRESSTPSSSNKQTEESTSDDTCEKPAEETISTPEQGFSPTSSWQRRPPTPGPFISARMAQYFDNLSIESESADDNSDKEKQSQQSHPSSGSMKDSSVVTPEQTISTDKITDNPSCLREVVNAERQPSATRRKRRRYRPCPKSRRRPRTSSSSSESEAEITSTRTSQTPESSDTTNQIEDTRPQVEQTPRSILPTSTSRAQTANVTSTTQAYFEYPPNEEPQLCPASLAHRASLVEFFTGHDGQLPPALQRALPLAQSCQQLTEMFPSVASTPLPQFDEPPRAPQQPVSNVSTAEVVRRLMTLITRDNSMEPLTPEQTLRRAQQNANSLNRRHNRVNRYFLNSRRERRRRWHHRNNSLNEQESNDDENDTDEENDHSQDGQTENDDSEHEVADNNETGNDEDDHESDDQPQSLQSRPSSRSRSRAGLINYHDYVHSASCSPSLSARSSPETIEDDVF